VYYEMQPVVTKASATPDGCAFYCPHYRERGGYVEYRKGDCPVADDLYDRVIVVWVGRERLETVSAIDGVLGDNCRRVD
jgi:hypothetical protein